MPRTLKDLFLVVVGACLSIGASPIAAHAQPATPPDKAAILAKGEYLARAGDCIACHTAREGKTFAGGLAMKTPFGTLYTSNITPDPQTGIGTWTADQFYTMMHNGRFPMAG
jgi:mono/diheme cytochrome c family protein